MYLRGILGEGCSSCILRQVSVDGSTAGSVLMRAEAALRTETVFPKNADSLSFCKFNIALT